MRAMVYHNYGSPNVLELQEIEKPVVKDGEVLVRVHAASVNPHDWHFLTGTPFIARLLAGLLKPKDRVLGVDVAGRVAAVGANVNQFQPGDDVCRMMYKHGGFAEYVCVPEDQFALKPTSMSSEEAAAAPLAGITALQCLRDHGPGDGRARASPHAEREGFIRIFVDKGPPMARLLYEALSRGIAPDYVRQLLVAFRSAEPEQTDPLKTQAPKSDLIEPLSERELEVLQLIGEGLTNQEIASRLFLSLNTVKVHTRNIYGKLNVHSRTQAVARFQELGLLPRRRV